MSVENNAERNDIILKLNNSEQNTQNKAIRILENNLKYIFETQNLILYRLFIGIGTSRQTDTIINTIKSDIEEEKNTNNLTLILSIDGYFSNLRSEFSSTKQKDLLVPIQDFLYKIQDTNAYIIYLPSQVHSYYFKEYNSFLEKKQKVLETNISTLSAICKPPINTIFNNLLKLVTKTNFEELYIFNDSHENIINQKLKISGSRNELFENMCEIFYIASKAKAEKKYILSKGAFTYYLFDTLPVKKIDKTGLIYKFTPELRFHEKAGKKHNSNFITNINYSIKMVSKNNSALGAGAGHGGTRKRNHKKRKTMKKH